jgi:hypothetical protein
MTHSEDDEGDHNNLNKYSIGAEGYSTFQSNSQDTNIQYLMPYNPLSNQPKEEKSENSKMRT